MKSNQKGLAEKVIFILVATSLSITALYSAWYSSYFRSNNGDALVEPYLFGGHFWGDKISLSSLHSNILKFPLFVLQAHIPFNFVTYTAINFLLFVLTIFGWIFLMYVYLGKRAALIASIALAFFMAASSQLNEQLIYTTVRNIEFPISLLFVAMIAAYIFKKLSSRRIYLLVVSSILFALTIAGDRYFLYVVAAGLLISCIFSLFWWPRNIDRARLMKAFSIILLVIIASVLINKIFQLTDIYRIDNSYQPVSSHVSAKLLWPSIIGASRQLGELIGIHLSTRGYLSFLPGMILLFLGVYGFVISFSKKSPVTQKTLMVNFCGVIFVLGFCVYIASGTVVSIQEGHIVNLQGNDRYITLLPFLLSVGVWQALSKVKKQKLHWPSAIYVLITMALIGLSFGYVVNLTNAVNTRRESYVSVASKLHDAKDTLLLSGYWYGAATKFWSHDQVNIAPVNTCNWPYTPNARMDWFIPSASVKRSAYLIDPVGPDKIFFGACTKEKLKNIFGKPSKIIYARSYVPGKPIELWIYNYDIRTKLIKL